jgi:hypothetical protein
MNKTRSVCRDWEFVSKGTEISLGKFVSEYFTPLTLDSWSGVVSTEDTDEIWRQTKEELLVDSGRRSVVDQGKGVDGNPQDLRDREGGWSEDHRETTSYASRQA